MARTLFQPTTLGGAMKRLGFVQADPIRSPATAQDLVLRHRVKGYRSGDLDRAYATLPIEEDYLYAYGFVSRELRAVLHPRAPRPLTALQKKVLAIARELGETHPRALEEHLGAERVVNAWGGYSKATTHALDALHHRGLLRVARREGGVRVYAPVPAHEPAPSDARLRAIIRAIANLLAPVPLRTLRANIGRFRHLGAPRAALDAMIEDETFVRETVDGIEYLDFDVALAPPARVVRFLAPFDPVVWDRARFEHLWGWRYRFEAYTPKSKRVRGYYAMPLAWGDRVIGWANVGDDVTLGFVGERPRDRAFRDALEREIESMRAFLRPRVR
jgi:hypothetical protein